MTSVILDKKEPSSERLPLVLTPSRKSKLERFSNTLGRPMNEIISALIDAADIKDGQLVITQKAA